MQQLLQVPHEDSAVPVRASLLQANVGRIRHDRFVQPARTVDADASATREIFERAIAPHLLDDVGRETLDAHCSQPRWRHQFERLGCRRFCHSARHTCRLLFARQRGQERLSEWCSAYREGHTWSYGGSALRQPTEPRLHEITPGTSREVDFSTFTISRERPPQIVENSQVRLTNVNLVPFGLGALGAVISLCPS